MIIERRQKSIHITHNHPSNECIMNIFDISLGRTNFPANYVIHQDQPIFKHYCTAVKSEFPTRCTFENKSNYTKDSSVSSTDSRSSDSSITNASVCASKKSLDQSHNSNYSLSKICETARFEKLGNECNDDIPETVPSEIANSSSVMKVVNMAENVKITKSLSLEYTSTTRITPPRINDCPEIVRTKIGTGSVQSFKNTDVSWQLQCDHQKLTKSDLMSPIRNVDGVHTSYNEDINNHFLKAFTTRSIQTVPVLILPICNQDKMVETDVSSFR